MRQARYIQVAIGLSAAALALSAGLFALVEVYGRPWSGLPLFANGVAGPRILASPTAYPRLLEIVPGTRLVEVAGRPLNNPGELLAILSDVPAGSEVEHVFRTRDGRTLRVALPVSPFDIDDALGIYPPILLAGLLFLLAGAIPSLAQPESSTTGFLAAMTIGMAANFAFLLPDYFLGHHVTPVSFVFPAAGLPAFLLFALAFPTRRWPLTTRPRATSAVVFAASVVFWAIFAWAFESRSSQLFNLEGIEIVFLLACLTLLLGNLTAAARQKTDAAARRTAGIVLPSAVLFVVVAGTLAATTWGVVEFYPPPGLFLLPVPFVALSIGYGMIACELFEVDRSAQRLLARSALLVGALALLFLLLATLPLVMRPVFAWVTASALTLLTASALPLVTSFYARVDQWVEEALFPQEKRMRESLRVVAAEVGRLRDSDALATFLRHEIGALLAEAPLTLVCGEADGPLEEIAPAPGRLRLDLDPGDPLHESLCDRQGVVAGQPRAQAARDRVERLGAACVIPLACPGGAVGGLLVGPRGDAKPHHPEDIQLLYGLAGTVGVALENARRMDRLQELQKRLEGENLYLRAEVDQEFADSEMIGQNRGVLEAIAQLRRVASTDVSVLIVGETGTGKELAVRTLHAASARADRVLVKLACAALPEALLESELFGHERGAFTGADRTREGRFEIADGGTLFFDDVDTLGAGVQAKLLRALQEGEVQRLGSNHTRKVDVRVVAATNRDLAEEVRAGRFREDLYYRLAVVPIRLPPLRERIDDIERLVAHLASNLGRKLGREITEVSAEALAEMRRHSWPGNIRELRNVIERALVLESGPVLRLSGPLAGGNPASAPAGSASIESLARGSLGDDSLADLLTAYKRALVEEALQRSGGNQRKAAELLGMHRPSLTRMIRDLGLRKS